MTIIPHGSITIHRTADVRLPRTKGKAQVDRKHQAPAAPLLTSASLSLKHEDTNSWNKEKHLKLTLHIPPTTEIQKTNDVGL
jgi:hypothetical protein